MIRLRDIRPEDKPKLREWRNREDIRRYMYSDHVISEEEHDRWYEERVVGNPRYRYWMIVCDDVDVGSVHLYDIDRENRRCFWSFYLADGNIRGRGVGSFVEHAILTTVFGELGLDKLCCEVLGFNEAVVGMHERFGFRREGLFRAHIVKGGEAHDVVALAILRSEWETARPAIEARLREKGILE